MVDRTFFVLCLMFNHGGKTLIKEKLKKDDFHFCLEFPPIILLSRLTNVFFYNRLLSCLKNCDRELLPFLKL